MKIQSVLSTPADIEAVRARVAPAKEEDEGKPKEPAPEPVAAPKAVLVSDHDKELERIASEIEKYVRERRSKVDISVDADLKTIVTKVLEADSGKVIRQFPEDAVLAVMKHLKEYRGTLVNRKG